MKDYVSKSSDDRPSRLSRIKEKKNDGRERRVSGKTMKINGNEMRMICKREGGKVT